jgi:hypothetical protein
MMKIAAPTTHTHGCAYQVVVVVLVVISVWLELELSWPQVTTCIRLKKNTIIHLQVMMPLVFFMISVLNG